MPDEEVVRTMPEQCVHCRKLTCYSPDRTYWVCDEFDVERPRVLGQCPLREPINAKLIEEMKKNGRRKEEDHV